MAKVGAGKLILREGGRRRETGTKNVSPRSSIHPFAPKQQELVMSLRRGRIFGFRPQGRQANCEFFVFLVFRFEASVCSVVPKEGDRRLHFNLSLRHFPFRVVAAVSAAAVKRTGISLLGGKKWPHTSLRAFFLSFFLAPSPLPLALSRSREKREKIGVARARSPQSCDANERFTWLSVCPMIALSFTATLLQLFLELFACENITSALPALLPLYRSLFCHEIQCTIH